MVLLKTLRMAANLEERKSNIAQKQEKNPKVFLGYPAILVEFKSIFSASGIRPLSNRLICL